MPTNAERARMLLREANTAALGTLGDDGAPVLSHVATTPGADGAPLLLLSSLSRHTTHLKRDPRASLLLVGSPEAGADPMTTPRLTLTGEVARDADPGSRDIFLARHPDAALYADFADFAFFRFDVREAFMVAGFGRAFEISADELIGDQPTYADFRNVR